jgi:acyl-CoA thioesterase
LSADRLLEILALKQAGNLEFTGASQQMAHPGIFGGQLLAQVLYAAAHAQESPGPIVALSAVFLNF